METHRRSLAKAATYRLFATSLVFLIAFLYTGRFGNAAKIGVSAAVTRTALHYLWERLWSHITWGWRRGSTVTEGLGPGVCPTGLERCDRHPVTARPGHHAEL